MSSGKTFVACQVSHLNFKVVDQLHIGDLETCRFVVDRHSEKRIGNKYVVKCRETGNVVYQPSCY